MLPEPWGLVAALVLLALWKLHEIKHADRDVRDWTAGYHVDEEIDHPNTPRRKRDAA